MPGNTDNPKKEFFPGKEEREDREKHLFCILSEFWIVAIVLESLWIVAGIALFYIFDRLSPSTTGRLDNPPRKGVTGNLNNPCIRSSWGTHAVIRIYSQRTRQPDVRSWLQISGIAALRFTSQIEWWPRNGWISLERDRGSAHRRMESKKKKKQTKKKQKKNMVDFCFVGKLETVITRTWNILSTIVSLLVEITTAVAIKPDRGVNLQLGWITRERVNHWREMKFSNVIEIRTNRCTNRF